MRLPRDSSSVPAMAVSAPHHPASSPGAPFKLLGNKENVQPPEGGGGALDPGAGSEASAAANLLWLLDFRLDNLLPNDGNGADKASLSQGTAFENIFSSRPWLGEGFFQVVLHQCLNQSEQFLSISDLVCCYTNFSSSRGFVLRGD